MNALKHTGGLDAVWEPSTFDLGREPFHFPASDDFPDRMAKSISVEMIHPEIDGHKITVATLNFDLPRVCALSGPQSLEETLANVALVSAAPAMLRALYKASEAMLTMAEREPSAHLDEARFAVRDAIFHATRKLEVKPAT